MVASIDLVIDVTDVHFGSDSRILFQVIDGKQGAILQLSVDIDDFKGIHSMLLLNLLYRWKLSRWFQNVIIISCRCRGRAFLGFGVHAILRDAVEVITALGGIAEARARALGLLTFGRRTYQSLMAPFPFLLLSLSVS